MDFILTIAVSIEIYAILAVSYDLVLGQAGLFSLAHGAFFATGAYSAALLATKLEVPILLAILAGMAIAAVLSLLLASLAIRVSNDYLVIASIGFETVLLALLTNLTSVTGGVIGVGGIPPIELFGFEFIDLGPVALLFLVPAAIAVAVVWRLAHSPFGRALRAVRENVPAAGAVGKSSIGLRLWAFAIAGALAALAGGMYAAYIGYISPGAFNSNVDILVLAMVIIGGTGSIIGPVIGAVLLITLPALLALLPLPAATFAPAEQAIYGLLLVVIVALRPGGLYSIGTALFEHKQRREAKGS